MAQWGAEYIKYIQDKKLCPKLKYLSMNANESMTFKI